MKKLLAVISIFCALVFSANVVSADSFPAVVGPLGNFLSSGYFNGASNVPSKDFSGTWFYTAIAFDAANVNITESPNSVDDTFNTNNTSNFGQWKSINFNSGDIYFSDTSNGPINKDLDPFNLGSNWDNDDNFKVYRLTANSNSLEFLNDPFKMLLLKDTIIVGWEDNPYWSGDHDYNDLVIAMYKNGEGGYTPVPEPATMLLVGIGLIGIAGCSRKKFKKA